MNKKDALKTLENVYGKLDGLDVCRSRQVLNAVADAVAAVHDAMADWDVEEAESESEKPAPLPNGHAV